MYIERYKTTKFIDFVNFKVRKSCLSMTIHYHLALIFRVTVLIQQIFKKSIIKKIIYKEKSSLKRIF